MSRRRRHTSIEEADTAMAVLLLLACVGIWHIVSGVVRLLAGLLP